LERGQASWFGLAGAGAGLATLSRSDGLLLLLVALPLPWLARHRRRTSRARFYATSFLLFLTTFLLITAPWFYRNWRVSGAPLPGGGLQALWFRSYNDLYSYGRALTAKTYLDWGWHNILSSKLHAAASNLITVIAVDCLIFLFPLALVGLWTVRRRRMYWPFLLYAPLLWSAMTLAFTYPGLRGGLLHASAAWLPFLFPAATVGLDRSLAWVARRRRTWDAHRAGQVFCAGIALLAVMLSGWVYVPKVLGDSLSDPAWNQSDLAYGEVGDWLDAHAAPTDLVMINNPPSFYYHTRRSSIVVPAEGPETLVEICDRYGVRFVVLDHNIVPALVPLYQGQATHPRLIERACLEGHSKQPLIIYQVLEGSP
jgi:hypothetical protein